MNKDEEVANEAIQLFTPVEQLRQFTAELNEMCVEINRLIRGDNNIKSVTSEFADVKFTMLQVYMILQNISGDSFGDMVDIEYQYKVERTKALINARKKQIEKEKEAVKERSHEQDVH